MERTLRFKLHSFSVFILTFLSYSLFHANRKTFSNLKSTISDEWSPTFYNATVKQLKPDWLWNKRHMFDSFDDAEVFLGVLDTTFLFSYAVGLYISGIVGDRFPMRYVLTIGMCSTAVIVFFFGVLTEWLHFYNKYLYVFLWILNGLSQSTGWPTVVAVMGNWFGKSSRGLIFGLWSACASVGNIIGTGLSAAVLDYGYEYAFLVTSVILFCGGVIVFFGLVESPRELGYPIADEISSVVVVSPNEDESLAVNADLVTNTIDSTCSAGRQKPISFFRAILLPGVIMYALAYACLKLVNYSLFFWLPYYLKSAFHWKETVADEISIWYDVGGIVGGTIIGFISDFMGKRAIVVIPMLALGIPSLFIYSTSPNDKTINSVLLSVVGFFIGGVANLISAAISADLGRQDSIAGNAEALATVTGIVDGTGSTGAALGQIVVPEVQKHFSWHVVFYIFIVSTFLTGVCIVPLFVREIKELYRSGRCCCNRRRKTTEDESRKSLLNSEEEYGDDLQIS